MTSSDVPNPSFSNSLNVSASTCSGRPGERLISELTKSLSTDPFWSTFFLDRTLHERSDWALHVAVFQEPFLTYVFDGRKRVESRFSQNQVSPFGEVQAGDVIALKRVGGPIVGVCCVNAAWSYRLDPKTWMHIRERFAPLLGVDNEDFWTSRADARFATLISIDRVRAVSQIEYPKSDRRGWVVERSRMAQGIMDL